MKPIIKSALLLSALSLALFSCKKKPDTTVTPTDTTAKKGQVGIEIHNHAGSVELALDSTYTTPASEQITISKFNYYISNIKLKKSDGTEFKEEESYHLVTADKKSSGHFHLDGVPAGSYTSITFLIGVDSFRNVDGAQTGALDQANGMFWTWSTGYIMAKLEGTSPQASGPIQLHIGGFKGEYSGIRTVTLNFAQPITVSASAESTIDIKADVMKWFGPNEIKLATTSMVMNPGATSKKIADNYANMFTLGK